MTRDAKPKDSVERPSPKGADKALGPIPRGVEVLVKKAAIDPDFKQILMERRAKAADEIGLTLEPTEATMLAAVPAKQLETIIANTKVSEVSRAAFMGRAATVMLAALGAVTAQGCSSATGSRPVPPPKKDQEQEKDAQKNPPPAEPRSAGSRPDTPPDPKPPERPKEIKAKGGSRPDKPISKGDKDA